jgi:hypothetical protein
MHFRALPAAEWRAQTGRFPFHHAGLLIDMVERFPAGNAMDA